MTLEEFKKEPKLVPRTELSEQLPKHIFSMVNVETGLMEYVTFDPENHKLIPIEMAWD